MAVVPAATVPVMHPQHKVKVDFETSRTYLMDGILCRQNKALAVTTSSSCIKLYDVNTTGHLSDIRGHTEAISDIVTGTTNSDMLFTIQKDTGVMISDLRQNKPVHFLNELTTAGKEGNTLALSPSDLKLAIAAGGDIHIVDTRTWHSMNAIEDLHSDDITRMRYCREDLICSAGEDQLINIYSDTATEDDMMFSVVNCMESCNKMRFFPQLNMVAVTGTCENGYLIPVVEDASEVKLPRRDDTSYIVDYIDYGDSCLLAVGGHAPQVDDGEGDSDPTPSTVGPIDLVNARGGGIVTTLPAGTHEDVVRVILRCGDGIITAGEDGVIAWWGNEPRASMSSHSSSSSENMKQRAPKGNVSYPPSSTSATTAATRPKGGKRAGKPY